MLCSGICSGAQPYLAILVRSFFPERTLVAVTDGLKTQESFLQDAETWLAFASGARGSKPAAEQRFGQQLPNDRPLFYPAWEILPHESKLPHADVISERLETLVRLNDNSALGGTHSSFIVTNVVALMQRTFGAEVLRKRTRQLNRGDRMDPLELMEQLQQQGYEPEAKVTQKGETSLRGGIDVYRPQVRGLCIGVFGDELESLRHSIRSPKFPKRKSSAQRFHPRENWHSLGQSTRMKPRTRCRTPRSHWPPSLIICLPTQSFCCANPNC